MATITKEEFGTLPESLKAKFKETGDGYTLIEEDVEGLKKSKAEILEEKKRLQAERDELAKFKADKEAEASKADEDKLKKAGEFAELEKKLRDRIGEVEAQAKEKESQFLSNLKSERLKNLLIEKGVEVDRARYALSDIADQFDLASDNNGFSLKVKNGIGDAGEIDGVIGKLRESSPFLFKSTTSSGSGASGSNGSGATADSSQMDPTQRLESYYTTSAK